MSFAPAIYSFFRLVVVFHSPPHKMQRDGREKVALLNLEIKKEAVKKYPKKKQKNIGRKLLQAVNCTSFWEERQRDRTFSMVDGDDSNDFDHVLALLLFHPCCYSCYSLTAGRSGLVVVAVVDYHY